MTEPSQYKTRDLSIGPLYPLRPALGIVAGGAPVTRGILHDVVRAQDTFATSGRRIVGVCHMHGSGATEINDDTDPDGAAHDYPYSDPADDALYSVRRWFGAWHGAPGHDVEQWCLALPGGPTESDPSNLKNGEKGANALAIQEVVRESLATAAGPTSTASVSASPLEFNAVPTANSPRILRMAYSRSRMYASNSSKAVQADSSESPLVYGSVDRYGASRIHSAVIAERPSFYSRVHNADWSKASLHCYTASPTWPDSIAREKYPDGTTFDEPRYGLDQAYGTAVRQADSCGPVFVSTVFDQPFDRDPEESVLDMGIQIASGTPGFASLLNSAKSSWDADEPGWVIPGYMAAPQVSASHEASRGGSICVVPVRVSVYYRSNGDDSTFRVMSSGRSFVDVPLPDTAIGWASACGYLEAMRGAEDTDTSSGAPVIQMFAATATAACTILSVTVQYGHNTPWQAATLAAG
jgi:hypothetical protein